MRTIIAGNWKMHMEPTAAAVLAGDISRGLKDRLPVDRLEVLICPPSISLSAAHGAIDSRIILIGGQNMHAEPSGAFTGEISAGMLRDAQCTHVILGHSERRHVFGETDDTINAKVLAALKNRLVPILCVGETEVERDRGLTFNVVERQLRTGLMNVTETMVQGVVIAYEPVWAIGTGRTASPDQAREVHAFIRVLLNEIFRQVAAEIPILYGGSVKPGNVDDLLAQPDINGALVGGASLKADSFIQLVEAGIRSVERETA
ncbi:MAG TPA: triose-phosphate isomerase [bacterium]|nr:triose-phosphate isomerase [bacterium]